jgi:hypothetical protein
MAAIALQLKVRQTILILKCMFKNKDWRDTMTTGAFSGGVVIISMIFGVHYIMNQSESTEKSIASSSSPSMSSGSNSLASSISSPQSTSNTQQIGWIRIGAVGTKDGRIIVGQKLIDTNQPVTIHPSLVPSIGSHITIINSVNVRVASPQPPSFELPMQKAALPPGQKLVVINTNAFVDPRSASAYTIVWAEVGIQ